MVEKKLFRRASMSTSVFIFVLLLCSVTVLAAKNQQKKPLEGKQPLRFDRNGSFKILQVADMHYADGKKTRCEDVLPQQFPTCSDLNTTAFINRMILAEKPNFIVFAVE